MAESDEMHVDGVKVDVDAAAAQKCCQGNFQGDDLMNVKSQNMISTQVFNQVSAFRLDIFVNCIL